ncbi:hypothetical protein PMIN06_010336 [Paraphaeosphaeria minitans]|uniref:Uncharacterized protein n=1 Tax=Paraphaeosphaeria minitans TaxID=565426 RepID=A0A9P6GP47_9PLEO|nr:hypothetical protein PMIN01_05438 [Paraphaeosphaeria minitans]
MKPFGNTQGKMRDKFGQCMLPVKVHEDKQTEILAVRLKPNTCKVLLVDDDFFDPTTAADEDFEPKLPKKKTNSTNANDNTKDNKGATGDPKSSGGGAASQASS